MLKDTFFTILSSNGIENGSVYRIALNGSHIIFKAHFAGNPIMPGSCILQMIKELASEYFEWKFFICSVKNMKFLHAVIPSESPEIFVQLTFNQQEDGRIKVTALLYDSDKIYTKSALLLKK